MTLEHGRFAPSLNACDVLNYHTIVIMACCFGTDVVGRGWCISDAWEEGV